MTGAAFRIMERKENKNERVLEALASESGVAIVVLDKQGNERAAANNNSICQNLYPSADLVRDARSFAARPSRVRLRRAA